MHSIRQAEALQTRVIMFKHLCDGAPGLVQLGKPRASHALLRKRGSSSTSPPTRRGETCRNNGTCQSTMRINWGSRGQRGMRHCVANSRCVMEALDGIIRTAVQSKNSCNRRLFIGNAFPFTTRPGRAQRQISRGGMKPLLHPSA